MSRSDWTTCSLGLTADGFKFVVVILHSNFKCHLVDRQKKRQRQRLAVFRNYGALNSCALTFLRHGHRKIGVPEIESAGIHVTDTSRVIVQCASCEASIVRLQRKSISALIYENEWRDSWAKARFLSHRAVSAPLPAHNQHRLWRRRRHRNGR